MGSAGQPVFLADLPIADQDSNLVDRSGSLAEFIALRAAGKDLGGRRQSISDSQVRNALRLVDGGEPASQVARDLGMSRATFYRRSRDLRA